MKKDNLSGKWKRKQVKKVVKAASKPLFSARVLKRRQPVQFGIGFPNIENRSQKRLMNKHSKDD